MKWPYLSVEAVSALQHTQVLLGHVLMADDTGILHVQLYKTHIHQNQKVLVVHNSKPYNLRTI